MEKRAKEHLQVSLFKENLEFFFFWKMVLVKFIKQMQGELHIR